MLIECSGPLYPYSRMVSLQLSEFYLILLFLPHALALKSFFSGEVSQNPQSAGPGCSVWRCPGICSRELSLEETVQAGLPPVHAVFL